MEQMRFEKSCLDANEDKGYQVGVGHCSILNSRLDFVSKGRRCYEKILEPLCATIDCKFDASGEECAHTSRPVNVSTHYTLVYDIGIWYLL